MTVWLPSDDMCGEMLKLDETTGKRWILHLCPFSANIVYRLNSIWRAEIALAIFQAAISLVQHDSNYMEHLILHTVTQGHWGSLEDGKGKCWPFNRFRSDCFSATKVNRKTGCLQTLQLKNFCSSIKQYFFFFLFNSWIPTSSLCKFKRASAQCKKRKSFLEHKHAHGCLLTYDKPSLFFMFVACA